MSNPFSGILYFFQGVRLIVQPGLRRYVMMPLLINIILFGGLMWLGASQFEVFMNWLMPELPGWLQWAEWLLWAVFAVSALLILFFTFSLLANIVAAPFNGLLAEAVELHLSGEPLDSAGGWQKMLREIIPTIIDELRKLLYLLMWSVPFLLLFLIPGINLIAPFTWLAFSAWMLAVEYADYPMGNHGLRSDEQKQRLGNKRLLSLGFGGAVTIATMIPIVNFLVMPAAVAGATAMWVRQFKD
ncbi:MAG: sulfate transporter CysZ [Gammaproteobacteria bacterium]|nr:sulfate transporter CysZ [Gammaproteobacteria bacterium]MCF6260491.1 sulfate transporter CysZ [Gammaproteobacteria bacterium]